MRFEAGGAGARSMASSGAFGVAAAADAALAVPRVARPRGIGPGEHVSVRADVFGKEYAKDAFGANWRSARAYGTVQRATGKQANRPAGFKIAPVNNLAPHPMPRASLRRACGAQAHPAHAAHRP